MRLGLVHDYLYVYGGAERMLEHVHAIWPTAPIYSLMYVPERLPVSFRAMDIRTTWVDRLPWRLRLQRIYAMLQPLAFATLRPASESVVSLASFGAKAVSPAEGGKHVSYCFTPPRFLWGPYSGIERHRLPPAVRAGTSLLENVLRRWDRTAAQRVHHFITQSAYVAARIKRVYGRDSIVIPPPVDVERFTNLTPVLGNYFLIIARFEAYKRIDLAIEATSRLGIPLRIIGSGVDEPRLRRLADDKPTVQFLGQVDDATANTQLAACRALLFTGEEDFGLTAVEAQAAGKPVIAFAEGGARETVVAGQTGAFFPRLDVDSLADAIADFDPRDYDPAICRANAARFGPERFRREFRNTVDRLIGVPEI